MDTSLPRDTIFSISRKTQVKLNFSKTQHTREHRTTILLNNFAKKKKVLQKYFCKYFIAQTWGAAVNLSWPPSSRTYFSHNPISLRHGLKFPLQQTHLRQLLSIQRPFNTYWSPRPNSFRDFSLISIHRKSCTRQVVFHQHNLLNLLTFPKEPL